MEMVCFDNHKRRDLTDIKLEVSMMYFFNQENKKDN